MASRSDFCIIGGGVAGLSIAWRLAQGGASVTLLEREKLADGASYAAAGMLAPLVEARLAERDVVGFGYQSLQLYPRFVAELEEESGVAVDYRTEGTLVVASERDHLGLLQHYLSEQQELGLPVEWLSGYDCRAMEPYLAAGVPGGIFSPEDRQIDNRLLLAALVAACRRYAGVRLIENAGEGEFEGMGSGGSVRYTTASAIYEAGEYVIATGAYGALLGQCSAELGNAVRPVKGQILRLDQRAFPIVRHVVRTPEMYLAPKSDGTLVLGASSEDRGFDRSITAGEIYELLRAARETVPAIYELPIIETRVGFRPATVDHAPMLGPSGIEGISIATGYYRHGILFSPHAAEILTGFLLHGTRSEWLDIFSPERFYEPASKRATT